MGVRDMSAGPLRFLLALSFKRHSSSVFSLSLLLSVLLGINVLPGVYVIDMVVFTWWDWWMKTTEWIKLHSNDTQLHRPAGAAMNSIKPCVTLFSAINYFIYETLYHWGFPQISPKGGFVRFSWLLWTIFSVPLLNMYTQRSSNL